MATKNLLQAIHEGLVYLYFVAFVLEPAGNGAFRHALAKLRHRYRFCHDTLL